MLKKIICILLLMVCTGCNKKNEIKDKQFIEPVNDVLIMSKLDDETYKKVYEANGKEFENYQFKILFKDVFSEDLEDINGRIIRLGSYSKLVLQVVSINCAHCHTLLKNMENMKMDDLTYVLYFDNGDSEEIRSLLASLDLELSGAIIVPKNKNISRHIRKELDLKMYPTTLFYCNGKMSFSYQGEFDEVRFGKLCNIGFDSILDSEDFVSEDGVNVISLYRGFKDIENDLGEDKVRILSELSDDEETVNLTYSLIGKKIDYDDLNKVTSSIYLNEIDDFSYYKDKKTVIFFMNIETEDDVAFINELIADNEEFEYFGIMNDSFYSSSDRYLNMNEKLLCKVSSNLAAIPEKLSEILNSDYPYAVFVDNGTICGAYIPIENKETFKKATELFLSENSIAYVNN